jgi:pimeloyl-ACP methyl ester carboxylesterase
MLSLTTSLGISYTALGKGMSVIMIHGIGASRYDWSQLMPEMAEAGYRVIAPDLPGHGDSHKSDDPKQYHIEAIYSKLSAWIESLDITQPFILVGHSLGGYLSLLHSARAPQQVYGLVLIDPLYSPKQLAPLLQFLRQRPGLGIKAIKTVPEWLINAVLGWDPSSAKYFSPQARQQIANDYKRASPLFLNITRDIPDLSEILPQIYTPTKVIWGQHDLTLRPSSFISITQILPNATGKAIPHTGHQPHIGRPDFVNRLVLEFSRSLDQAH